MSDLSRDFTGHRVIVTGGASGIGKACVDALRSRGAKVAIIDRSPAQSASDVASVQADLAVEGELHQAFGQASQALGGVDGLVSAAGISIKTGLQEETVAEWNQTLAVNAKASFLLSQNLARSAQGPAAIVLLSSIAAFGYSGGLSASYHASKGAIAGLARYLAIELAPRNITVNAVAPGLTRTPLTQFLRDRAGERFLADKIPSGRIVEPEEVASAVLFLLSGGARSITGTVLPIDGGVLAVAQSAVIPASSR
jgi:NAD(P)-dependent dehydrogenase (short-subunit alcohol dehydrogenase family)